MKAKRDTASLAAVHVHFTVPPGVALQVERAVHACRTTKKALWIAAMREFLGNACEPSQAVPANGIETCGVKRMRA